MHTLRACVWRLGTAWLHRRPEPRCESARAEARVHGMPCAGPVGQGTSSVKVLKDKKRNERGGRLAGTEQRRSGVGRTAAGTWYARYYDPDGRRWGANF